MAQPSREDPFLRALGQYWAEVLALADGDQRERLEQLVRDGEIADLIDLRAALADEVLDFLPAEHPVIQALLGGVMAETHGGSVLADLDISVQRLRELVGPMPDFDPLGDTEPEPPGIEEPAGFDPLGVGELTDFDRVVQADLRSHPAVRAAEVRRHQVDPGVDGLIRLPGVDGDEWLPAFQFDLAGRPWGVVLEINELLDAVNDPWGVMCWWVYPHARLAATPADLLGRDDPLLLRAATAVLED